MLQMVSLCRLEGEDKNFYGLVLKRAFKQTSWIWCLQLCDLGLSLGCCLVDLFQHTTFYSWYLLLYLHSYSFTLFSVTDVTKSLSTSFLKNQFWALWIASITDFLFIDLSSTDMSANNLFVVFLFCPEVD